MQTFIWAVFIFHDDLNQLLLPHQLKQSCWILQSKYDTKKKRYTAQKMLNWPKGVGSG